MRDLPDGLTELGGVLELGQVMRLIEQTARWVDPETFKLLPVWYPEHARKAAFFKSNWSEVQQNRNRTTGQAADKSEGNTHANKALTKALGLRSRGRLHWSCCHIWGADDPLYQTANFVVQDRRFFSCLANMVLLPTPLKAFTDVMPQVKLMLRLCARGLYGWHCDDERLAEVVREMEAWDAWSAYPASWPRPGHAGSVPGIVPIDSDIRRAAEDRLRRIRKDLTEAGENYPREPVRAALAYWAGRTGPDGQKLHPNLEGF